MSDACQGLLASRILESGFASLPSDVTLQMAWLQFDFTVSLVYGHTCKTWTVQPDGSRMSQKMVKMWRLTARDLAALTVSPLV